MTDRTSDTEYDRTNHQEQRQSGNLDQGKPKLYFTEPFDANQFHHGNDASATRADTHCGTTAKVSQYCIYSATAVISTIAQFRKYIQPAT